MATAKATLGGGCFWCLEAVYQRIDGIQSVVSGYAGGHTPNPDYKSVCAGKTGHAEVIQLEYDTAKVTYDQVLDVFWACHDPTTKDRQGNDVGTQYRSIILCHDADQKNAAIASKERNQAHFSRPIVTEIADLEKFHAAETYHQNYYNDNSGASYCAYVIRPKLEKLGLSTRA